MNTSPTSNDVCKKSPNLTFLVGRNINTSTNGNRVLITKRFRGNRDKMIQLKKVYFGFNPLMHNIPKLVRQT